jgi:hypothetical protein
MEMNSVLHAPAALPRGNSPGTHYIGGWIGFTAGLDAMYKQTYFTPPGNRTPIPTRVLVATRTELVRLTGRGLVNGRSWVGCVSKHKLITKTILNTTY